MVSVMRLAAFVTWVSYLPFVHFRMINIPAGTMAFARMLYLTPSLAKVSVNPTRPSLAATKSKGKHFLES